jgi:predicted ATP-grasp superfamily ATP-dependent carboligase
MRQRKNVNSASIDDLSDHSKEEIINILKTLQNKILASSALNGGFERLVSKIELIDKNQNDVSEKIESIHDAIYHPDEGLFARVKIIEHKKNDDDKSDEKESKAREERDRLLKEHSGLIKELIEYKNKTYAFGKWCIVGLSGGGASLLFKLIYDFISGHIQIH